MELLPGPSLAIFKVINWAKFVFFFFFFYIVCQNTIRLGFEHIFIKRKSRAQIFKVINWAKLAFFFVPQLGPVNNFDLARLITLKFCNFCFICFKKCVEIPIFIVVSEEQPKFDKKWPPKTITFHILQSTGS